MLIDYADDKIVLKVAFQKFSGLKLHIYKLSRVMRKQDFCLCENKDTDHLRSNCEADQRLCFSHSDSTIPFLLTCISFISSFEPSSETVQASLC